MKTSILPLLLVGFSPAALASVRGNNDNGRRRLKKGGSSDSVDSKKGSKKGGKKQGGGKKGGFDFNTRGPPAGDNICEGAGDPRFEDVPCFDDDGPAVGGQAGADVTAGYTGNLVAGHLPLTVPYYEAGLCPVNVHTHLGAEHRSEGQYDEGGSGPDEHRRKLAGEVRPGFQCHHYDEDDEKFTTPYDWKYCTGYKVGETYETHWPHSIFGDCGTLNQYQSPFYDGVLCNVGLFEDPLSDLQTKVGVQAQVFTLVNDEDYFYPDLIKGMIVDGDMGKDMAYYTGSTTGTSRDNEVCSQYTPITWQVDRTCHLISASSFDKMCADMMAQRDDMSMDLYPHGSRELVADDLTHDNQQRD